VIGATLDGKLGVVFRTRAAQLSGTERSNFVAEQQIWIRDRNSHCGLDGKSNAAIGLLAEFKTCIAGAIQGRIAFLSQAQPSTYDCLGTTVWLNGRNNRCHL
jgi:hypothetical protein